MDNHFHVPGSGAFSIIGGACASMIGMITTNGVVDCIFYGALGATVGYIVKMCLDNFFKDK